MFLNKDQVLHERHGDRSDCAIDGSRLCLRLTECSLSARSRICKRSLGSGKLAKSGEKRKKGSPLPPSLSQVANAACVAGEEGEDNR
ncbi:hypothetical protein MRB53_015419 [Persea americana]|uniref:Uncharacterized protein n=1 Tax=Persea americana TaxID=3435 RepID=A0ACC2KDS9_PERAE|nr:hypothetical protein MRB53_015419 [Persea americana]